MVYVSEVFGIVICSNSREWVTAPFFTPFAVRVFAPPFMPPLFVLALHVPIQVGPPLWFHFRLAARMETNKEAFPIIRSAEVNQGRQNHELVRVSHAIAVSLIEFFRAVRKAQGRDSVCTRLGRHIPSEAVHDWFRSTAKQHPIRERGPLALRWAHATKGSVMARKLSTRESVWLRHRLAQIVEGRKSRCTTRRRRVIAGLGVVEGRKSRRRTQRRRVIAGLGVVESHWRALRLRREVDVDAILICGSLENWYEWREFQTKSHVFLPR